jgi:hypothetical protein
MVVNGSMQDVIAIMIVAFAAAFLVRRGWKRLLNRRAGACGACSNCPSSGASKTQLVSIAPVVRAKQ